MYISKSHDDLDNPTLDADGNLKNASDIEFFNSETDSHPIRRHGTNVEPEKRDKTGVKVNMERYR